MYILQLGGGIKLAHELEALGDLNGTSAQLYGYLFENADAGVRRDIYANLIVKCAPITYRGETWEPGVLIDWLRLNSLSRSLLTSDTEPQAESSFYMAWHDDVTHWKLKFQHDGSDWPKHVRYELGVNYSGYDNDPLPNLKISGSSPVTMTGISVMRDNFFPKPSSHDEAREMLAPHYPKIAGWNEICEEDEDGWPVLEPRSYLFSPIA